MFKKGAAIMLVVGTDWADLTRVPSLLGDITKIPNKNACRFRVVFLEGDDRGITVRSTSAEEKEGVKFKDFAVWIPWSAILAAISHPDMAKGNLSRFGFVTSK